MIHKNTILSTPISETIPTFEVSCDEKYAKEVYITTESLLKTHTITFSEHISHTTEAYYEILHFLYGASENDTIRIKLGNYGGALEQCIKICNAIKVSKAKVIISVDAPCYSAAAIIALSGNRLEMLPGTMLMFHNYSGDESGKAREVRTSVEAHNYLFSRLLETTCTPFLTGVEVKKIVNDHDVYIYDDDASLKKRVKRHFNGK